MKIKEQTRKVAADCSKHRFEVVDRNIKKERANFVLSRA